MKKILTISLGLLFPTLFFAQSYTEISTAAGITFLQLILTNTLGNVLIEKEIEVFNGNNNIYMRDLILNDGILASQVFILKISNGANQSFLSKICLIR